MIAIVDYKMGNVGSIANMLRKIGEQAVVTSDASVIEKAEKLILPGVGSFNTGMVNLDELGLLPVLNRRAIEDKVPVLGICLGMQLLTRGSEEGNLPGLGWIDAETVKFKFNGEQPNLKVPHMGWNSVVIRQRDGIFEDMDGESRFYFVHSYYVRSDQESDVLSTTHYGHDFVSAVRRGNIMGTQFHPEKSHKFGTNVFKNFVKIRC
ncbi:MAG: imidazole glycerol-phosphate synthase subunit HisH [Acidobacteriota bacterium]|jgi:glutamine amidotransferase|nr:imidazole glycerol-phosphate synthase subunit HisH [Acidobacteriota bacterium]